MELDDMVGTANEKRRITKPAFFVLLSVIFKRYSTAAVTTVMTLFVNLKLEYDKDVSTTIFHSYAFLSSCFSVVGAMIAESWFGIYRTIVSVALVYATGCFVIAIGVVDALYLPIQALSVVGLLIMAMSDGCITPLISTYGAYQYHTTEVGSIALFFVLYYFSYNVGSIIARLVNPILSHDVQCFGNADCFPVTFGISGIGMILVAIFATITNKYSTNAQATRSGLQKVFDCIGHALYMKARSKIVGKMSTKDHWLDYSEKRYGKKLLWETRVMLNVIVLYVPIILFWALFFQQGSRWIFQAVRMHGDIGLFTILPEQFNVMNPLLVLLLIPVFEKLLNPQLAKLKIINDLQKATLGGVLAALAFLASATVEWQLENGNHLHMAWLLPQYTLISMGEILVTIPMMNFSYSVAPSSMKTILQALNNISMGLGNLLVVVVVKSNLIRSQTCEFILFAVLMFLDMFLFAFLAKRYKPLEEDADERKTLFE